MGIKTIGRRGLIGMALAGTILAATGGFPGAHADGTTINVTNANRWLYLPPPTLVVRAIETGITVYGSGFTPGGAVDISYSQDPTQPPPGPGQGPEPTTAVQVEVLTADRPGDISRQCNGGYVRCVLHADGGHITFAFLSNPCRTWTVQGYDETRHSHTDPIRVISAGCLS